MELIPGLPNDLARECLIRINPYEQLAVAASVCKGWKIEIESPEFRVQRKAAGHSQVLVILAVASGCKTYLSIFEPLQGRWSTLPPIPDCSNGMPTYFTLVAVGSDILVLGGSDVYIYSFQSWSWRRGVDMPSEPRKYYDFASDGKRIVYVAGGECMDSLLKSAMAYDVKKDEWITMPDMPIEREDCWAGFHSGKFHIIGGYDNCRSDRIARSEVTFDPVAWCWEPAQEICLEFSMDTATKCVGERNADESFYTCLGRDVIAHKDSAWQAVAKAPPDIEPEILLWWHDQLLMVGTTWVDRRCCPGAYTLDLITHSWTRIDLPKMCRDVLGGCCLEV
ncbi:F-box/kelch-repeat protein At1g80440-like [Punica granatum]|uniref:F-box domain-containing protein n=2 Tax=Punica granatum TaxID=22663 RepID=A0A218W1E4_PUNGR|nr:F-box/kelch-repeat protein At1g80440-like [Punica granatum]OWM66130.1 hypothetical protein CDL15_Pgr015557 [Punica granatum]PKI71102.1 hypothetical protein CRG98_008503 [Punica granatum]